MASITTGGRIKLSRQDGIARLILANPARRNAVDLAWCREFAEAALACAADDGLRCILLAAEGDFFSVGGDIDDFIANQDKLRAHVLEMASLFHLGIMRLQQGPAPLVAAVQGMAAGGGLSLALTADIVLAQRSARFTSAYTKSGLSPDGGLSYTLPRLIGQRRAFDMLALNPVLNAETALAWGLITRVCDDAAFDAEVEQVVQSLAKMPAGTMAAVKRLMAKSPDATLQQQLDAEADQVSRLAASPATLAVLQAFLSRRGQR